MEHNCCNEAKWFLKYNEADKYWYVNIDATNPSGVYISIINFCPWCGGKLPTREECTYENLIGLISNYGQLTGIICNGCGFFWGPGQIFELIHRHNG